MENSVQVTELKRVKGVGPALAAKLASKWITSAEILAVQNPTELADKVGIGVTIAENIVKQARALIGYDFMSGFEAEEFLTKQLGYLTTGIPTIDEALGGKGFETKSIVEFYGPARSGKTNWCSQLAVTVQLPREKGGLDGRVIWLDTERTYKPQIIRRVAERFGIDPDSAVGNITYAMVLNSKHMLDLLERVSDLAQRNNVKLLVIDSFTGLFRSEFSTLDQLRTRQAAMNHALRNLLQMSIATDMLVVITNQVMAKISVVGGYDNAPVGGHIVAHASTYRIYLGIGNTGKNPGERIFRLKDAAGLPEFEVKYYITEHGLMNSAQRKELEQRKALEAEIKAVKKGKESA